jgi:hypothetical protein
MKKNYYLLIILLTLPVDTASDLQSVPSQDLLKEAHALCEQAKTLQATLPYSPTKESRDLLIVDANGRQCAANFKLMEVVQDPSTTLEQMISAGYALSVECKRFKMGEAAYNKALNHPKLTVDHLLEIGKGYRHSGQTDQAINIYKAVLQNPEATQETIAEATKILTHLERVLQDQ